jgi:CheY-like chemotaxis protein
MTKIPRILLVDDDETSNFITEKQLQILDVTDEVITVLNGLEAQKYFMNCAKIPDLVLVDINMPMMTGFEFLDWFESSEFKGRSKFSIYSTSIRREDQEQAYRYDDVISYIEKPLNAEKMNKILESVRI